MRQRDAGSPQSRYRNLFPVASSGQNVLLGSETFGKASATVFYKQSQSHWGVLDQQPAAVLLFHTDPFEPRGYKLRELQIRLVFSDYADVAIHRSIYIPQRPSPTKLKGGETLQSLDRNWTLNPQIPTPIGSVGLGSIEQRMNSEQKGYWTYESHLDGSRSAVWLWNANDANSANEDTGDLHGGLVLNHAGDDFFVTCTLEGKLVKGREQAMDTARKWFRLRSGRNNSSVLKISAQTGQLDLKQIVDGLEQKMKDLMRQSSASKH